MLEKTYRIASMDALDGMLGKIQQSAGYQGMKTKLLQLFAIHIPLSEIQRVRQRISQVLPDVKVAGISLAAGAADGNDAPHSWELIVNCCFFEKAAVQVWEAEADDLPNAQFVTGLGDKLAGLSDLRGIEVLYAGVTTGIVDFLHALAARDERVLFFGAGAGSLDHVGSGFSRDLPDPAGQSPYVLADEVRTAGVVLIAFSGEGLQLTAEVSLGLQPLSRPLLVTETMGAHCVVTIEDMPAADIYRKYLRVPVNDDFVANIREFPFLVERNGFLLGRMPPACDSQQRLYFEGDVLEGESLRFSYAEPQTILKDSRAASEKLRAFGPEGILLFGGAQRMNFLQAAAVEEMLPYRRLQPELVHCRGISEIYQQQAKGGILNCSLVAVGLREGDLPAELPAAEPAEPPLPGSLPLADRMAAFGQALAADLQQLQEKNAELAKQAQSANLAKAKFLANMSHEIRTPINAVMGMDELILRECQDPTVRSYAENIQRAGSSLLGIVKDVLDFSQLEAGELIIAPVMYSLPSVLNDLVNKLQQRAEEKALQLSFEVNPNLPSFLYGDELRMKQIIANLLTNAVKYTEKGQVRVAVDYRKQGEKDICLQVSVKDTGIGIRQEDMPRLFGAFERVDAERNLRIEGTGLGLNITQQLLQLMGSSLQIESVYGRGSTFSFAVRQQVEDWNPIGTFSLSFQPAVDPAAADALLAPAARILVVDDTAMNLMVMRGLLKRTQLQVDTAESGAVCLEMVRKTKYDVIFLDHRMPVMDGIETLEKMRQLPDSLNLATPVISLTANAVSGARELYLQAGFADYLTKPVDGRQLEQLLRKYLPPAKLQTAVPAEKLAAAAPEASAEEALPEWVTASPALTAADGIKYCGSSENYLQALEIFADAVDDGANEIEQFFQNKDWKDYTIKVHALKSTARMIGARELSEKAKALEEAGNQGQLEKIVRDTPDMLAMYRSYNEKLAPLQPAEEDPTDKPLLSEAALAEAYETLQELSASFDFDDMAFVLKSLQKYRIPEKEAAHFEQVRQAASKPDWDRLCTLLK